MKKSKIDEKAELICKNYKSAKFIADWEPLTCEYEVKELLRDMLEDAGRVAGQKVTMNTLKTAMDRVYTDGYYGPVSDSDWKEQDGRNMPMAKAKEIVRGALQAGTKTVEFVHPEFETSKDEECVAECKEKFEGRKNKYDDCVLECPDLPNAEWSTQSVKEEMFKFVKEIYGRYEL